MVYTRESLIGLTISALPTIIDFDGSINYNETEKVARFNLENNCDILSGGTTSQNTTISVMKRSLDQRLIKLAHDYRRRVVVNASSWDTVIAKDNTEDAYQDGADATLQVKPPYNKANPSGLLRHFTECARVREDLPLFMYDIPSRTGQPPIIPEVRVEVAARNPNIFAIKDGTGDEKIWKKTNELMEERGISFALGVGNDGDTHKMMKDHGALFLVGVDSVPFPHIRSKMTRKTVEHAYRKGEELHNMIKLFTDNEGATVKTKLGNYYIDEPYPNPFGVNAFLYVIGATSSPKLRLPLEMTREFVYHIANNVAWPMYSSMYREELFSPYGGDIFNLKLDEIEECIKRFL